MTGKMNVLVLSEKQLQLMEPTLYARMMDCDQLALKEGVIVGVSRVQPFFDEMIAVMTSAAMIGEADFYADQMAQIQDSPDFLPKA